MKKTCGLDVHKDTVFCGIYNGKEHLEVEKFLTTTPAIRTLDEHLRGHGVQQVAIESTGTYWVPVWNILEDMGFELILVNPYLIKQMPGRKSDIKDAQWIATLLYKGLLRGSLVPCKEVRELRTYSRKYVKLQQRLTSAQQEMERMLEICGIRITSFVSNISSKSVLRIIRLITGGEKDPEVLLEQVHGRIINKHSKEKIRESLTGFITTHHRFVLELALEEFEVLTKQSERCLAEMEKLCREHYSRELELLQTIPGVSLISTMIILAETGVDMKAFENSSKFAGWTGLRPRNDESAGKYKSTATTKGNKYLRAVLVQVAWAASRTKDSYFKEKFTRLSLRKPRKKALIAISRKIAVVIWNVLHFEQVYDPNRVIILRPGDVKAKICYHQREADRLVKLIRT